MSSSGSKNPHGKFHEGFFCFWRESRSLYFIQNIASSDGHPQAWNVGRKHLSFSMRSIVVIFPYAAFLTFDDFAGPVLGSIDNFSPMECSKIKMLLISGLPFLDSIR